MAVPLAIDVRDLERRFGTLKAVDGVSFGVLRGEVLSLLGPNGAGKSTVISILSGLRRATAGDAWVMGHSVTREPMAVKALLGVVPQDLALYPDLTARENLTFWGRMYGLGGALLRTRVDEVLELIGLTDRQHGRVETFSGGMKRRVNIAVALLHRPAVVIMDEPTVGIDPQSRRHILEAVKALNRQGMTVLYTTHYMEEAQELSAHIAIMDQGKVIATGTHQELVRIVGEQARIDLRLDQEAAATADAWRGIQGVARVSSQNGTLTVLADDSDVVLPRLFESAPRLGVHINAVEVREPNLEAVFLHLTGRALRN